MNFSCLLSFGLENIPMKAFCYIYLISYIVSQFLCRLQNTFPVKKVLGRCSLVVMKTICVQGQSWDLLPLSTSFLAIINCKAMQLSSIYINLTDEFQVLLGARFKRLKIKLWGECAPCYHILSCATSLSCSVWMGLHYSDRANPKMLYILVFSTNQI